jgi:hypothetical protein
MYDVITFRIRESTNRLVKPLEIRNIKLYLFLILLFFYFVFYSFLRVSDGSFSPTLSSDDESLFSSMIFKVWISTSRTFQQLIK